MASGHARWFRESAVGQPAGWLDTDRVGGAEHDEPPAPGADVETASVEELGVVNDVKLSQQGAGRAAL
jgi:hypothetical protein